MAVLRTDIERALDELASQEEGMRFQGLAVVLGKKLWPELIARQRKKDHGLDAYAPASLTPERTGKGLAASITPTLAKVAGDAETAKNHFPDLKALLFVTPAKVGNAERKRWEGAIRSNHDIELLLIEREEIITQLLLPENAALCASFLHLQVDVEPPVAELVERARRASATVAGAWAERTKGRPLLELTAIRIEADGQESAEILSLEQIDQALSESRRIVLEGPAGRGKTTTLVQLARRERTAGLPLLVELPAWISSQRGLLEFVADMPAFQAERLTPADIANVQKSEPFLMLLNGWNEVAESTSAQATAALRELERDFPEAGIVVATRTHHLSPPLPGALRLKLLRLQRAQRSSYLDARLGGNAAELRARIEADSSLDELTRTPLILAEVVSLFEAEAEIPSSKIGVLAEVIRLHEQRDEHRNALQSSPVFDRQTDFLKALATEMTTRGAVSLQEPDARSDIATTLRHLVDLGQIEAVGAPAVLATLAAHHVLERIDYPSAAFQFEHQQVQEYFAALGVQAQLLDLEDDDSDSVGRFVSDYVNKPLWAEPMRMIAETLSVRTGDGDTDARNVHAGKRLIEMALAVDPVFAGELAGLCGPAVWDEVRDIVAERFRAIYADDCYGYKPYATAAMMASGQDDFSDIIEPLLSSDDEQVRLRTHGLWPGTQVSILGPDWREKVSSWSEEARSDFVSESLDHGADTAIAAFAAEEDSMVVKTAAASSLMWAGSEDLLAAVLESMDEQTFGEVVRRYPDRVPDALRVRAVAAIREFVATTENNGARLGSALSLIEIGESGLDDAVKDSLAALPSGDMRNMGSHYIQRAVEYLRDIDSTWVSEWVAVQVAEDALHSHEYWLRFAHGILDTISATSLQRLETEDLGHQSANGVIAVIAHCADVDMAARIFAQLRELHEQVDANPGEPHELGWQLVRQLENAFRALPGDVAAAGLLQSVQVGDRMAIRVSSDVLSAVARPGLETLQIGDDELRHRLRAYLKSGLHTVLQQDDFNGKEKANLASALARVGDPEDMEDLVTLARADIDRVRTGRAARAAGDRGPRGNGAVMSYSGWHVNAITQLDSVRAEQVLIDLLPEPEYYRDVAAAMARQFLPRLERTFGRSFRYDLLWAAREGVATRIGNEQRRRRFAGALSAEMARLAEQGGDEQVAYHLKELAKALAAVDGQVSADTVIEAIGTPGKWDQDTSLDALERLLLAGVVLPAATVSALVDSVVQRASEWMHEGDRFLLQRVLAICPLVDDPTVGIAKIREVLREQPLHGHDMDELISALGESRSDAAVDLLLDLASDATTFNRVGIQIVDALAALDMPRSHEALLSSVDPDISEVAGLNPPRRDDGLVSHLADLSQRLPEVAVRLQELCNHELPEFNRQLLSKVMASVSTPESLAANLALIDDARSTPVPQGVRDQIEGAIIERRPYGKSEKGFTQHARAANEARSSLFRMASEDKKRRASAHRLLAHIESLRLDYGRPNDEPRHPDLSSGRPWPDLES